jgi:hypothetical protein
MPGVFWSHAQHNVCGSYVITLNQTPVFERHIARLVVNHGHQEGMCCNDIGLCAKYYTHSRLDNQHICEGLCVSHLKRMRFLPFFL